MVCGVFFQAYKVGEEAYGMDWVGRSPSLGRSISLIIGAANRGITLSAGGIYTVNREFMKSVCNKLK